jgi:hypothetical protein
MTIRRPTNLRTANRWLAPSLTLLTMLLLGPSLSPAAALEDPTVEQLDAPRARKTLYLRIGRDDPKLFFQVDDAKDPDWHSLAKDEPVSVLANERINIWVAGFNPLVQAFDAKRVAFDDATYTSFKAFAETLIDFSSSLGLVERATEKASSQGAAQPAATMKTAPVVQEALTRAVLAPTMNDTDAQKVLQSLAGGTPGAPFGTLARAAGLRDQQLLLLAAAGLDPDALMKRGFDVAAVMGFRPTLTELQELQRLLADAAPRTEAWLRLTTGSPHCLEPISAVLAHATRFGDLERDVATASSSPQRLKAQLAAWQTKANEGYQGLFAGPDSVEQTMRETQTRLAQHAEGLTKSLAELRKDPGWTVGRGCGLVRAQGDAIVEQFAAQLAPAAAHEESLAAHLATVVKELGSKYKNDTDWAGNAFLAGRDIQPTLDKGEEFTLTAKVRKITIAADGSIDTKDEIASEGRIRFRRYHATVPEAALGVALNSFDTPKYKAAEDGSGQLVVMDDGVDSEPARPFGMLNLLCRCGGLSLVHPGFQLGVTIGPDRPAFLVGGVLRLTKPQHFSFSAGAMYTQYKELHKLSVGDALTDKGALDADLSFKGVWRFYIGAQLGFKPWKK